MNWLNFRQSKIQTPKSPTEYPAGTFVKTEKGFFYIVNADKRYRLISQRVLDSWAPHRVVNTSEAAVQNYRIAARMKFRNGSLIHNLADGKIYLIEKGKRRHVVSPEAFERIGADYNSATTTSNEEILLHELGEELA